MTVNRWGDLEYPPKKELSCLQHSGIEIGRDRTTFRSGKKTSLFGCNEGWIPWFLQLMMPRGQAEPYAWHMNIRAGLALPDVRKEFPDAEAIIVDIKPVAKDEFFVCELLDVYGYSADEWTPMLWRMKVLNIGGQLNADHLQDFNTLNDGDIIYEFLYAMGSVDDGKLVGTWNPPKPSSTNGFLLWPAGLACFIKCIDTGH